MRYAALTVSSQREMPGAVFGPSIAKSNVHWRTTWQVHHIITQDYCCTMAGVETLRNKGLSGRNESLSGIHVFDRENPCLLAGKRHRPRSQREQDGRQQTGGEGADGALEAKQPRSAHFLNFFANQRPRLRAPSERGCVLWL